jgi:hypothetical protein
MTSQLLSVVSVEEPVVVKYRKAKPLKNNEKVFC